MKIDSHQHFWRYSPKRHSWINDKMAVLKRDFLPNDLQKEIAGNGVDGSVAVQADQSEEETEFLLKLAADNDIIKAVVGWVDLRAENVEDRLAYFASKKEKLKGFRHVVQAEPDVDFMLGKAFQRGIGLLEKYGFTYDILIYPSQLSAALKLVKQFPHQKFVIDHLAKPNIARGDSYVWKTYMSDIAKNENTYCKLSGMVTEASWNSWQYDDFVPYLDEVLEAFGTDRVMYGSDWPVCLLSGSYGDVKGIIDRYIAGFSAPEKASILGANAIDFYSI